MSVLWFYVSMHFYLDQKLCTQNVTQIITYSQETKQFLLCLNWWIMGFCFQNMFLKNSCFWFWWRAYTDSCTNNCNITSRKISFVCALQFIKWFHNQDMIWKMEEFCVSKNINSKYGGKISKFDFALLLVTLLTFSCCYCSCNLL